MSHRMSSIETLHIGTDVDGADATLAAARLNRHTFWCGQSGSGKTYALGVLLEQVLLRTRLPIVVLDPNSDFVRLDEVRDDAPDDVAAELATRDVRVLRSAGTDDALRVRFADLSLRSQAAVLQLDPVADAQEFNALLRAGRAVPPSARDGVVEWLRSSGDADLARVAVRIENLGVAEWPMWAWGERGVGDVLDERADATVVDLGGFATSGEPAAAALAVLDHLWERRHERVPRMIVVDEAHNLCPPDPVTPVERLVADRVVQIAAEGRKYGLWLVLSTQRPSKIHPNALSQCDNLVVLKMASPRDLALLVDVFGHVPRELVDGAMSFGKGEALVAGGFVDAPRVVRFGRRFTAEGGSDVAVPMR